MEEIKIIELHRGDLNWENATSKLNSYISKGWKITHLLNTCVKNTIVVFLTKNKVEMV